MLRNYDYQKEKKLIVSETNKIHQINVSEIEMIYSESGISTLTKINNEKISFVKNLSFFEKELGNLYFFKINRNILINARYITSFNCKGKIIETHNNPKMMVSRRNISKIRKHFCNEDKPIKDKNNCL